MLREAVATLEGQAQGTCPIPDMRTYSSYVGNSLDRTELIDGAENLHTDMSALAVHMQGITSGNEIVDWVSATAKAAPLQPQD